MTMRREILILIACLLASSAVLIGANPASAARDAGYGVHASSKAGGGASVPFRSGEGAACKSSRAANGRPSATICERAKTPDMQGASGKEKLLISGGLNCVTDPLGCAGDAVGSVGGAVGDAVAGAAEEVVGGVGEKAMDGIAKWVAGGVSELLTKTQKLMVKSTSPQVTASWFKQRYQSMMNLAGLFGVMAIVASAIAGVFMRDPMAGIKAGALHLPLAFMFAGGAIVISQLLMNFTDQLTMGTLAAFKTDTNTMTKAIVDFLSPGAATAATAPVSGFMLLIVGSLAAIGSLLIFCEMIFRESATYIILFFIPLGCVASIYPPAKKVARKMAMLLFVVIISKFFIVVIYGLGAGLIANAGENGDFSGVLAGVITMTLAAFSPLVVLKLLPFDELDAVSGRPNTPVGAQMAAQQSGRNVMSKVIEKARGGGGEGGGAEGGGKGKSGAPSGSPGGGSGGGGAAGAKPGAGIGGGSGGAAGGAAGGGAAGGGAGGGAAAGGAAAGGAAALPVAAAVGAGLAANAIGKGIAAEGSGRVGGMADSQGGGSSGGGQGAGSTEGGGASAPAKPQQQPAHIAARNNAMNAEVSSV